MNDCAVNFATQYSDFTNSRQPWSMGDSSEPAGVVGGDFRSEEHVPACISNSTISKCPPEQFIGFHSYNHPVDSGGFSEVCVFNPSEQFSVFQQYDHQIDGDHSSSDTTRIYSTDVQSYQCSDGFPLVQFAEQEGRTFQSTSKAVLKSDQCFLSEKPYSCSSSIHPGNDHKQRLKRKLVSDTTHSDARSYTFSTNGNQDGIYSSSFNSSHCELNFSCHEEKYVPKSPCSISLNFGNSFASGASPSNKPRMRWTPDLHEKFVECVNRLGGADKATPKAIHDSMNSEGLTIFQIKSHLQRYRFTKYMPESPEGNSERSFGTSDVMQHDMYKTGIQLKEALHLQLDVQRRLHEQLEIQRNLQLRIEEQGRQLKMMLEQQQNTKNIP